ncbi:uncharacterized protein MYCFIDRAFT_172679 [Pseudocercospora fijiensis CIRAD86]|uniref:Uncharacterized protein n=1 Tax=Pseudocercospora fijiensis (strain CIRAD86) TaxID=383855 RepID=M2ZAY5_PSEFD|nr:uncharacterized protein MYCFIDRAFT_172679 [Pseudocercospora fijiensis CIRAD86]EME87005.1 hypothetical protein MYCFIDRAFT_172679 [Pseudocercospora fijiensis CIRAD86]
MSRSRSLRSYSAAAWSAVPGGDEWKSIVIAHGEWKGGIRDKTDGNNEKSPSQRSSWAILRCRLHSQHCTKGVGGRLSYYAHHGITTSNNDPVSYPPGLHEHHHQQEQHCEGMAHSQVTDIKMATGKQRLLVTMETEIASQCCASMYLSEEHSTKTPLPLRAGGRVGGHTDSYVYSLTLERTMYQPWNFNLLLACLIETQLAPEPPNREGGKTSRSPKPKPKPILVYIHIKTFPKQNLADEKSSGPSKSLCSVSRMPLFYRMSRKCPRQPCEEHGSHGKESNSAIISSRERDPILRSGPEEQAPQCEGNHHQVQTLEFAGPGM